MSFIHKKGKTRLEWLPVTTSTALAINTLVEFTSGLIAAADEDDTMVAGVLAKTIAATDADYATARLVPIRIPLERMVLWEADGEAGDVFVATDIGTEFGIKTSGTVDRDETTAKLFLMTKLISSSKIQGYLKINGSY